MTSSVPFPPRTDRNQSLEISCGTAARSRKETTEGNVVRGWIGETHMHEVDMVHWALERQRHRPGPRGPAILQVVPHLVAVAEGAREDCRAVQRPGGGEEVPDGSPPEEVLCEVPPDGLSREGGGG